MHRRLAAKRTADREVKRWRIEQNASSEDESPALPEASTAHVDQHSSCCLGDDDECVGLAMPELARWCRQQLRDRCDGPVAETIKAMMANGGLASPAAILEALSRSSQGRDFLASCTKLYAEQLEATTAARERARLLAALASVSEAAGQLNRAVDELCSALLALGTQFERLDDLTSPPQQSAGDGTSMPLAPPLLSATVRDVLRSSRGGGSDAMEAALLSEIVRLRRQQCANRARADCLRRSPSLPEGRVLPLPREESGLSAERFFKEYALRRRPVVMALPPGTGPAQPWSLVSIREHLGEQQVELKHRVRGSCEWAGLERAGGGRVGEFIASLDAVAVGTGIGAEAPYLFDWSLPQNAPTLLDGRAGGGAAGSGGGDAGGEGCEGGGDECEGGEGAGDEREGGRANGDSFVVPRFFSNDFLQRTPAGSLYRESWPSLFVGLRGSRCSLHIDTFGSHFWMMLFEGEKEWTIFPSSATPLLQPSFRHSHDAVFAGDVHATGGDGGGPNAPPAAEQPPNPLLRHADRYQGVLRAGECLFVPAGCAHAVRNLSHTLAISANFVDASNLELVRDELAIAGLRNPEAATLLKHLSTPGFDSTMDFEVGDLPWREFKRAGTRRAGVGGGHFGDGDCH